MTRIAQCSCGALQAHCSGEPLRVSVCHCLDCQRRTGSAFGVQSRWTDAQVTLQGQHSTYQRTGDTGKCVTFQFCPNCAAIVSWQCQGLEGFQVIPVGAFADPTFPAPSVGIYETRRHLWTDHPNSAIADHWD